MFRRQWPFIDLQLFGEGETPEPVSTATEEAPVITTETALEPQADPEAPPRPSAEALNRFFADLEAREAGQQAEGGAAETSPAGSPPPTSQAAPVQGEVPGQPVQAPQEQQPTQPPVVQIPADLLTVLGQLATRALPEPTTPVSHPEPELPSVPEPPEILRGTKEELETRVMEDPVGFQTALIQHELAKRQVEQERQRILAEHKQKVELAQKQESFKAAFIKQVQTLGMDVFNHRAPLAEKVLQEMPYLMQLPPEQAVEAAFRVVADREAPRPIDPQALTPEQKAALKAALGQEIVQEYIQKVATGQKPPVTISSSLPAGKPSVTPANRPRTIQEAKRQWQASMPQ
ncbi:MAG TPA: hypothetical protein GX716_03235 [Firmicutes bacterium]|nr:hypothetical protein [Candidatus Fermentithermobacillaceae bacterium]